MSLRRSEYMSFKSSLLKNVSLKGKQKLIIALEQLIKQVQSIEQLIQKQ